MAAPGKYPDELPERAVRGEVRGRRTTVDTTSAAPRPEMVSIRRSLTVTG